MVCMVAKSSWDKLSDVLRIFVRVSSVLNRDVKQFGKKFMFDGEEDTCWNSDQVCNCIVQGR